MHTVGETSKMLGLINLIFIGVCIAYSRSERCCLPSQIQASVVVSDPFVPNKNSYLDMYFDFQNKRTHTKIVESGEHLLMFYNENIGYIFNETVCNKGTSGPWTGIQCIPDQATASKPYSIGWQPNITLVDYYWQDENVYIQMTTMNCKTPIEAFVWNKGSSADYDIIRQRWQDFLPMILDKHAFDVPDICKKATMTKHIQKAPVGHFGQGSGLFSKKYTP